MVYSCMDKEPKKQRRPEANYSRQTDRGVGKRKNDMREEGTNSRKTEIDDYLQSLYKKWLDKKRGATQPDSRKYPKFKTPSSYAQRFKVNSYLAGRFIRMFSSLEIRNVGGYVFLFWVVSRP